MEDDLPSDLDEELDRSVSSDPKPPAPIQFQNRSTEKMASDAHQFQSFYTRAVL